MKYDYDPIPLSPPDPLDPEEMLRCATQHYEYVSRRRTVRHFSSESISRDVIQACILTAGSAPSGANHQPWHFACVSDPHIKRQIRLAAEAEERAFYDGKAGEQWLEDLQGLGTDAQKPFLETAPWLIAVFAERYSLDPLGHKQKNYYVPESVGIATGLLITALHNVGLATLTHTPNPMKFLSKILGRPANERATMLLVVGHPAEDAKVPRAATVKKPLHQISTFLE
ncbi:nitroreductase family protein [Luminiphilus sp.]|nr:nitroreductase family protein [Luminiphilus sp.]MDA8947359.1 nitroreductase family protein [Luminiphilus sp.]MDB2440429.1 nitroreductase family protein [Luminiphilus sp.]MDB2623352.1 nitroreductase family protein [Luminiphilus sp.]MDB2691430.1 nitroreductase family protein [Luminiphilus sp.]